MSTHSSDHAVHVQEAHDHHDHHDTFWTKYVFSQDHKMISKQFLVTAILMAFVAMTMSLIFRLQLGWRPIGLRCLPRWSCDWRGGLSARWLPWRDRRARVGPKTIDARTWH